MAGAMLTIGGAFNSQVGIVSVPSSFLGDTSSTSGSLNYLLEKYLVSLTSSIQGGTYAFENNDIAASSDFSSVPASVSGSFEEFTNTDTVGGISTVSANGSYSVSSGVTDVVVQAPGDVTLAGNGTTKFALFGAGSNVTYTQSTGGSASIVAAGGTDVIRDLAMNVNDTVWSGGNDLVSFNGINGNDVLNADGNATTTVLIGGSNSVTVTASDNAKVDVLFFQRAGGSLDFINNSSQAQTIYSGAYANGGYAANSVTVNAGAGGGYYVGGRAGANSLVGGAGAVTLIGGGVNDTLIGSASTGGSAGFNNVLVGGPGAETLIGASGSGSNAFEIGTYSAGIGAYQASGLVSTSGSGLQVFNVGSTNGETIAGSNVAGASNIYQVIDDTSVSITGSSLEITNFSGNSTINLVDSTLTAPGASSISGIVTDYRFGGTDINLADGTQIILKGVSLSHVATIGGGSGITSIVYNT